MRKALAALIILVCYGVFGLGLYSQNQSEGVEFPEWLKELIKTKIVAEKCAQVKGEDFEVKAIERLEFLNRCRETEPLRFLLSLREDLYIHIVITEGPGVYNNVLALNSKGICVFLVHIATGQRALLRQLKIEGIKEFYTGNTASSEAVKSLLTALIKFNDDDIFNMIGNRLEWIYK